MSHRLPVFAIALCVALPAVAQPAPPTGRIPTVTRLVKLFSELEAGLVAQAHATDTTALDQSLDPSFEMRTGAAPGVPVPRDEWILRARAAPARPPHIDQMAVHDFGDVAVVSFREFAAPVTPARLPRGHFVVDCWKRAGDGWKLAVRYVSDAAPEGVKPPPGTIDKRY
jgi:hypothetical protein